MIKYYDSETAYKADSKSAFESQVSLIGASNECKYDGRNVVVGLKSATTGSIAVLDGLHALHFITPGTFNQESFFPNYEVVGVVAIGIDHPDFRGKVGIIGRADSYEMLNRWEVKLTGYTLGATSKSGTLVVREASDGWAKGHEYTISYKANTTVALVAQLNAYFKANEPFISQDWVAVLREDGNIYLHYKLVNWQQCSGNGAKSGFTVTHATAPGWDYTLNLLRRNGVRGNEGTTTNLTRALVIYRGDYTATSYNPNYDITTKKLYYPICLPAYLGTSQYQSDHCAYLRSIYGEGEKGWLKFMESFLPVRPAEYGVLNEKKYGDGRRNTYYLANLKYVGQDGRERCGSPAAEFVAKLGYDHELLKAGEWFIPSMDNVFSIVSQLKYPDVSDINADKINAALNAVGCPALSTTSSYWSSSRYNMTGVWMAYGSTARATAGDMIERNLCVPLVLLDVNEN